MFNATWEPDPNLANCSCTLNTYLQCRGLLWTQGGNNIRLCIALLLLLHACCGCCALHCQYYCVHVTYVNSTNRVHNTFVHMRWHMCKCMSIVLFMHWHHTYPKYPVSWLDLCTYVYVCMKVYMDIHRAKYSSSTMGGYFLLGWLYDTPVLFYVT